MPRYEVRLVRDAFGGQAKDVIEADRLCYPKAQWAPLVFERVKERDYGGEDVTALVVYAAGTWERVVRLYEEPKP